MITASDIRRTFLDFFVRNGHTAVQSSSLVPRNDPTLMFANSGMVQFKNVFTGAETRPYTRATTAQKCVRAGGKHNDLENVGYTARHHTFFEMLGNFSFGDYFKPDAIEFAWKLITGDFGLSPDRLTVTVYAEDDDAHTLWRKIAGLPDSRIIRIPTADNFWRMGDTGPCGPCTEIFFDHGDKIPGGPPGSADQDGDRFIEIWNLVFMQYEQMTPDHRVDLPRPSIDTGMGLERLTAVLQGKHDNYDIDLMRALIVASADATNTDPDGAHKVSHRVIADHLRSTSFLLADGVMPSNEGRGYVLRRIIRRAIRHGYQLGIREPFFHKLVAVLESEMGGAYPELTQRRAHVERVLAQEETRFAETLTTGMSLLEAAMREMSGTVIDGATVFKLYDTYGFPVDLTADVAREHQLTIDQAGFEAAMDAQRERARAASRFGVDMRAGAKVDSQTQFHGYDDLAGESLVVALLKDGSAVEALQSGQTGEVFLEATPFYAESGGQVGDAGELAGPGIRFVVSDTLKRGKAFAHVGKVVEGRIRLGDRLGAQVDTARRAATVLNHSATHLLHAALRQVLGTHVQQKGSLVAPDRLRFDFSHFQPVTPQELTTIERLVNAQVRRNEPAQTAVMEYDQAVASGAMALFGEKYDDEVRVLKIGDFSTELCGGTHVSRAGDIGLFKIVSESGVAAGVRRIEAVTGDGALAWVSESDQVIRDLSALMKASRNDVEEKVRQLVDRSRRLEKEVATLKSRLASGQGNDLSASAIEIAGVKVVVSRVDGADAPALRAAIDQLKSKLKSAIVVLASVPEPDKVIVIAGVTADLVSRLKAGDLVNVVAQAVGGRGGGRADLAQAGGNDPSRLETALASVPAWIETTLGV